MKGIVQLLNDAASLKKASIIFFGCLFFVLLWIFYKEIGDAWGVPDAIAGAVLALFSFSSSVIFVSFFEWFFGFLGKFFKSKKLQSEKARKDLDLRGSVASAIPHMTTHQRVIIYLLYQGDSSLEVNRSVELLANQNVIQKVLDLPEGQAVYKINPFFYDVVSEHLDDIFENDFIPRFMGQAAARYRVALNIFYSDENVEKNSGDLLEVGIDVFNAMCDLVQMRILYEEDGGGAVAVFCLSPEFVRYARENFYRRKPLHEKIEVAIPEVFDNA
ncbi:hypothetical protein [Halomonas sp. B23F22_10]|uniref:hypothetical protein n=1 Tax=Halomonas sp. B23F22_10 TaxID=3459515 RepID=UPI00373E3E4A